MKARTFPVGATYPDTSDGIDQVAYDDPRADRIRRRVKRLLKTTPAPVSFLNRREALAKLNWDAVAEVINPYPDDEYVVMFRIWVRDRKGTGVEERALKKLIEKEFSNARFMIELYMEDSTILDDEDGFEVKDDD